MATNPLPATAPRIRALREALGLTQEALANAAGVRRWTVVHLENGPLKASTLKSRHQLAAGFGVTFEIVNAYLDGALDLAGALKARNKLRTRSMASTPPEAA